MYRHALPTPGQVVRELVVASGVSSGEALRLCAEYYRALCPARGYGRRCVSSRGICGVEAGVLHGRNSRGLGVRRLSLEESRVTTGKNDDAALDEGRGCGSSDGRVGELVVVSGDDKKAEFGKHHARNVAKRERRKRQNREKLQGGSGASGDDVASACVSTEQLGVNDSKESFSGSGNDVVNSDVVSVGYSGGYFSECSLETKKKLKESRASMLVAQNELRAAEAVEKLRVMQLEKSTRLMESKFELNRVTVEDKLAEITKRRFGVVGSAETVVSSAVPSLSSGSVSPNSSISVAEEMKLRKKLGDSLEKIAKLEESIRVKERTDGLGYDWGDSASAESIYGDDVVTGMFVDR